MHTFEREQPYQSATSSTIAIELRQRLVQATLEWEAHFGVAPSIVSAVSEIDAAFLVGAVERAYCENGKTRTAVQKDFDFVSIGIRYQIIANRPSGKPGSPVTLVSRKNEEKRPFGWDRLIWVLYDRLYVMQEAWEFTVDKYRELFASKTRLSPKDMRLGRRIFPAAELGDRKSERLD